MAATPFTATAGSDGTCTVTVSPYKAGIQWTVGQTAIESLPTRTGATCITKLNGNLLTSSQVIPATAGGQPAINMQATDIMTFEFAGLTAGDTAKVTVYYNESAWGTPPNASWV